MSLSEQGSNNICPYAMKTSLISVCFFLAENKALDIGNQVNKHAKQNSDFNCIIKGKTECLRRFLL